MQGMGRGQGGGGRGDCFDGDGLETNDDDDEMGTTFLNRSRSVGMVEHVHRLRSGIRAQWNQSRSKSWTVSSVAGSGSHTSSRLVNSGGIGEYMVTDRSDAMAL